MKKVYKACPLILLTVMLATVAHAQRARTVSDPETATQATNVPVPPAPPKVVPAKYMGGFAGYRKKQEGMLSFDDRNRRLVFRDKNEKEIISIAYDAVMVTYADRETRRMMGQGTSQVVLGGAGILGMPALLLKKKFEYLTIEFEDPDSTLKGTTQFKLKDREIIDSVAYALAQKSGLMQRGEIYVRKKNTTPATAEKTSTP